MDRDIPPGRRSRLVREGDSRLVDEARSLAREGDTDRALVRLSSIDHPEVRSMILDEVVDIVVRRSR